jgi:serine/threonine-protein kinase
LHNPYGKEEHHPLIHRDVKPQNLMFGWDERIRLTDYDLALLRKKRSPQDADGTIEYMAPEQLGGRADTASDQYALGVVAYELLSGYPPFRQADPSEDAFFAVIDQHMNAPPPPLDGLPDAVAAAVLRALEKQPEARHPTVLAFAQAFERAVGA